MTTATATDGPALSITKQLLAREERQAARHAKNHGGKPQMPEGIATPLSLETLHKLDPEAADRFDQLLYNASVDVQTRQHIMKKRTVTLTVELLPHKDGTPVGRVGVQGKTPPMWTDDVVFNAGQNGQLLFDYEVSG